MEAADKPADITSDNLLRTSSCCSMIQSSSFNTFFKLTSKFSLYHKCVFNDIATIPLFTPFSVPLSKISTNFLKADILVYWSQIHSPETQSPKHFCSLKTF